MKIYNDIEIVDLALKYKKNLIFADFHIGFEEALNKQGVLVPRFQFNEVIKRLDKIFERVRGIKRIIINGDVKHEFGKISDQEWRDTLKLLDYFMKKGEIILVKGNHDSILGPIAEKREIKIVDRYDVDDITILHGDKIVKERIGKILIIGHEHPAVSFKERRDEKYKCFLLGRWKGTLLGKAFTEKREGKVLIVQPSFNLVTEGSDISKENLLSPYLKQDLDDFRIFVVEDKVYDFGKVKNLK